MVVEGGGRTYDAGLRLALLPPNTGMEPTPLCGRKLVGILKPGIGPIAFPI
jgi:hypothetical protein